LEEGAFITIYRQPRDVHQPMPSKPILGQKPEISLYGLKSSGTWSMMADNKNGICSFKKFERAPKAKLRTFKQDQG
jgi:hypothetical protein